MRLLNVHSFELESFADAQSAPPYAILSHTWREGEVLFEDITKLVSFKWKKKAGYKKIQLCSSQAKQDKLDYVWIDTCCIDKNSSAELSEAINSMMKWYFSSRVCYAYLDDRRDNSSIDDCRWFTRGWTLQELIAPQKMNFYDSEWSFLGSRNDLGSDLKRITRIDEWILGWGERSSGKGTGYWTLQALLERYSVATRMSWASQRTTTRVEDTAYCLMGLFDVNMPVLYGEGNKAFYRLQEHIMSQSSDTSILAFDSGMLQGDGDLAAHLRHSTWMMDGKALATHPKGFRHILPSISWGAADLAPTLQMGSLEIKAELLLCPTAQQPFVLALFDCTFDGDYLSRPAILLRGVSGFPDTYVRVNDNWFFAVKPGLSHPVPLWMENESNSEISEWVAECGLTIDPLGVTRKTITIANRQMPSWTPSERTYISHIDITIHNHHSCPRYIEGASNTVKSGNLRFNWLPGAQKRSLYGIMKLATEFDHDCEEGVFITWGVDRKDDTEKTLTAICKLWTRGGLTRAVERHDTNNTDEGLIRTVRRHDPDTQPHPSSTSKITLNGTSLPPYTITACIETEWFFGRPIMKLAIAVNPSS